MLEHEARHLPGALSIPLADLPTRLKTLPKDKLIVTYCRARSALMPTRLSSWCWPTAAAARGSRRAAPSGVRPSTASSTALQPTEHARRKSTVSRVSWREGPSGVTSRSGSDRTLSVIQTRGHKSTRAWESHEVYKAHAIALPSRPGLLGANRESGLLHAKVQDRRHLPIQAEALAVTPRNGVNRIVGVNTTRASAAVSLFSGPVPLSGV